MFFNNTKQGKTMNRNNDRVLAYQKSKLISKAELQKIAGGVNFCTSVSHGPSGGCGANNIDQCGDVHIDW